NAVNQEANLVKARTVASNDARNAARLEDLHGRGLIAAMDRDNAKTNAESSQASLAAAEAQLAAARSQIETQRSQLALAQSNAVNQEANLVKARTVASNDARNAARLEDLHGRGLIAAMDRDNAKTNAESSQASLAAAEAQLAAARSQIETQRSQLALAQSNADGA